MPRAIGGSKSAARTVGSHAHWAQPRPSQITSVSVKPSDRGSELEVTHDASECHNDVASDRGLRMEPTSPSLRRLKVRPVKSRRHVTRMPPGTPGRLKRSSRIRTKGTDNFDFRASRR